MRHTLKLIGCGMTALLIAGCAAFPGTAPVGLDSPEAARVRAALARWPQVAEAGPGIKRPLFMTLHAGGGVGGVGMMGGARITASGVLEYYGPREFRLTAVTEIGAILFDGRMNWAGPAVLRQMPGLDRGLVERLLHDLSVVFNAPADLTGLRAGDDLIVLDTTGGDTRRYTWVFDPATGRPRTVEVALGTILRADFLQYDERGWPREIHLTSRSYDLTISFTDDTVVRGP